MIRRLYFVLLLSVVLSACKLQDQQSSEDTKSTISLAEGVDSTADTTAKKPIPMPKGIGDSILFEGVRYQVLRLDKLSDTSKLLFRLPKSDSAAWWAVTTRCTNLGNLRAQPHWGTLEIVSHSDTVSFGAVIFRTDWGQQSLQPGQSGIIVSVYHVPVALDGFWFWHPSAVHKSSQDSTLFRIRN